MGEMQEVTEVMVVRMRSWDTDGEDSSVQGRGKDEEDEKCH